MQRLEFTIFALCRLREDGLRLATPVLMPHLSALGRTSAEVVEDLQRLTAKWFEELPPLDRHRLLVAEPLSVNEIELLLESPRGSSAWQTATPLTVRLVTWQQQGRQRTAYIPALDVTIVADESDLAKRLEDEVWATLKRRKMTQSWRAVQKLCRETSVEVLSFPVAVNIPNPKEWVDRDTQESKPVLPEVAQRMRRERFEGFGISETVSRMIETLTGRKPRGVLLVGPSGVGKTAAFLEMVRLAEVPDAGLVREFEFWRTSGSRLIAGASGFGGWQERCQKLCKEVAGRKLVLHVGSLRELIEVGKCGGCAGIGEFLRPAIERSEVLAVAECTPEERGLIERENPSLLQAFVELRVNEPDEAVLQQILNQAARQLGRGHLPLTERALDELDRLHRRYATASVAPGRPLRFLRNLVLDQPDLVRAITPEDVIAAFSQETGLPRFLLDPALPMSLYQVRNFFESRVMGQADAVQVVTALLATVKTRMARPGKPLASLLFLGPTGVGKTEMSKALAEFFFHDRNRMIRIDASEFGDAYGVQRLIGGLGQEEGVLTSKVRDQPFSVVLLDEFEKAHPAFFDMLLQVLGEGRLTDAAGRLADFRNCVIVMTSNLGAASISKGAAGFTTMPGGPIPLRAQYLKQVQTFLRPEMFNRIDSIVPFAALGSHTLTSITRLELRQVEQRDGLRSRRVVLDVAEPAIQTLVELGTEPLYGARPLKRAIERHLLAPLAAQLNRYPPETSLTATAVAPEDASATALDVRIRPVPLDVQARAARENVGLFVENVARLRRIVYRADAAPLVLDIRNETYRLALIEQRWHELQKPGWPFDPQTAARFGRLRKLEEQTRALVEAVTTFEENALVELYSTFDARLPGNAAATLAQLSRDWESLLFSLFEHQIGAEESRQVLLAIYSDDSGTVRDIARVYRDIARLRGDQVISWLLRSCQGNTERELPAGAFHVGKLALDPRKTLENELALLTPPAVLEAHPVEADHLGQAHAGNLVGVVLRIQGPLAEPFFSPEDGLHVQKQSQGPNRRWIVHASRGTMEAYLPPADIDREKAFLNREVRRTYVDQASLKDLVLGQVELLSPFAVGLHHVLTTRLRSTAEEAIVS